MQGLWMVFSCGDRDFVLQDGIIHEGRNFREEMETESRTRRYVEKDIQEFEHYLAPQLRGFIFCATFQKELE